MVCKPLRTPPLFVPVSVPVPLPDFSLFGHRHGHAHGHERRLSNKTSEYNYYFKLVFLEIDVYSISSVSMESILSFIFSHASHAHWVIFSLLMLAGLNLPISEDLLIIVSATCASTLVPENVWKLFFAVFLGAYLSDWIPYWIGRRFGASLWNIRWFSRMIKKERLEEVKHYYAKYGVWTLIIGRFIPFGVRNCLFAAAGMGRMSFWKFLLSDGIACLISNTVLFSVTYFVGEHYSILLNKLKWINITLFLLFLIALITFICYKRKQKMQSQKAE